MQASLERGSPDLLQFKVHVIKPVLNAQQALAPERLLQIDVAIRARDQAVHAGFWDVQVTLEHHCATGLQFTQIESADVALRGDRVI